jgi:hypothetical protein
MTRLFDAYFAVDWSARSLPGPGTPAHDGLWVGEQLAPEIVDTPVPGETYWRTRQACFAHIQTRLLHHMEAGRRVLIGFDFPYGYPAGYAAALGLDDESMPPWRRIWNELQGLIVDEATNRNNRFAVAAVLNARCSGPIPGPLWGCPAGRSLPTLAPTSPPYPYPVRPGLALERLRWTERNLPGIQPAWKLFGHGSAGGQALVGIPVLCRLRADPQLAAFSRIWPFETGFTPPPPEQRPSIIHAEIWPGMVPDPLDPASAIRDQAQVRAVVRWLARLDSAGQLSSLFALPPALSPEARAICVAEEGWILGATGLRPVQAMAHRQVPCRSIS